VLEFLGGVFVRRGGFFWFFNYFSASGFSRRDNFCRSAGISGGGVVHLRVQKAEKRKIYFFYFFRFCKKFIFLLF